MKFTTKEATDFSPIRFLFVVLIVFIIASSILNAFHLFPFNTWFRGDTGSSAIQPDSQFTFANSDLIPE